MKPHLQTKPTKTSFRRGESLHEEPDSETPYRVRRPKVLVLEESHSALLAPVRQLEAAGYTVQSFFEEPRVTAKILATASNHFLLLTARNTGWPLRVPQTVENLRRSGYVRPITYAMSGRVSAETRKAYEDLLVNRVLSLPVAVRASVLDALAWIHERVDLHRCGVTVLEV